MFVEKYIHQVTLCCRLTMHHVEPRSGPRAFVYIRERPVVALLAMATVVVWAAILIVYTRDDRTSVRDKSGILVRVERENVFKMMQQEESIYNLIPKQYTRPAKPPT